MMPSLIVVRAATRADSALNVLLAIMAGEFLSERVGSTTVLAHLADIVIARVLRAWVEAEAQAATGWLGAVGDPRLARALAAIHSELAGRWSVEAHPPCSVAGSVCHVGVRRGVMVAGSSAASADLPSGNGDQP